MRGQAVDAQPGKAACVGIVSDASQDLTFVSALPILSEMVNYQAELDRTFAALSDPTRRAILTRLERENSATVSHLASRFSIKLPAVLKHLGVLDEAGLITRSKSGRTVTVQLRAEPMRKAQDWLQRYERFWLASLDRLAAYAESKEADARKAENAAQRADAEPRKPKARGS
jgi:DNA-binding transcriptional ArsR family regulator